MPKNANEKKIEEIFPREIREKLLDYLLQHDTEVNFITVCKTLGIDYINHFVPALDLVPDFRNAIIEHLERLKFFIIESINKRVTGEGNSTMPIAHAKFMLELIDSHGILPRTKMIVEEGGEEQKKKGIELSRDMRRRLGLGSAAHRHYMAPKLEKATILEEEEEEENADVEEMEKEEVVIPKSSRGMSDELPDEF